MTDDDTEYVDADWDEEPTDDLYFNDDIGETTLKIADPVAVEEWLQISGYDTDSDDAAHICCSECGERIELVTNGWGINGGVCGCRETPKEWRAEQL